MSKLAGKAWYAVSDNVIATFEKRLILLKYIIDFCLVSASYWLSYFVRFEGVIPHDEFMIFKGTLGIFLISFMICNFFFGLAKGIWRYASLRDIERIGAFVLAGNGLSMLAGFVFLPAVMLKIPRSIYLINASLLFLAVSGSRLSYRVIFDRLKRLKKSREKVLIIGDKDIAASLQYSILKDHSHQFNIVGFITFDRKRLGNTINAIPIIGMLGDIQLIAQGQDIQYIFIAVDSASNDEMKGIIQVCQETEAHVRIVPSIVDVVSGRFSLKDLREVTFDDYLARDVVEFSMDDIAAEFRGKNVLVTGGGGSVGSSICRELVNVKPARLIVADISEDNLFKTSCELADILRDDGNTDTEIVYRVVDVKDKPALVRIFEMGPIDYVIHAAAKKHVHFSESNPHEAIATNVCGTYNVLTLSCQRQVKKCIYISTDKAVSPTAVMGATKRVGELLVKYKSQEENVSTSCTAVRFGNVIGSSGNVIEVFTRQLMKGEPLTITDPDMERYFMSLNEATRLILKSACMSKGGEIFVLDMGNPIKIKDLAYDIALFYGKHLKDDDIVYTGARAGEKLHEQLFNDFEKKVPTDFSKIFAVEQEKQMADVVEDIEQLCRSLENCSEKQAKEKLFHFLRKHT